MLDDPSIDKTTPRVGDITVVLTAYRRPDSLADQLDSIRKQTVQPRQVWVWANAPDESVSAAIAALNVDRVATCFPNAYFHARFALAQTALTQYVAVFDDDSVPGTRWFENCLETMAACPGILGSAGVRLSGPAYTPRTICGWHAPSDEIVEVDLVGHAWFLATDWVHLLFSSPAVTGTNGEDIELSARALRLAGIRTFCPPHPVSDMSLWGSTRGAELGADELAASRRVAHLEERECIVRAEIAAGWKPLFLRDGVDQPAARAAVEPVLPQTAPSATPEPLPRSASGLPESANHVLELLPGSAKRVLMLGSSLDVAIAMKKRGIELIGMNVVPHPAFAETQRCDFESLDSSVFARPFDAVICLAIDQVRSPERLLEHLRRALVPNGSLILVVPNLRRREVISAIVDGRWQEAADDNAPLRYFTRRELEKLLYRGGFSLRDCRIIGADNPNKDRTDLKINGGEGLAQREFQAAELVMAADSLPARRDSLTSIVLVTHNELAYTRLCLDSIRLRTDEPYELIFVDNGSTDGTTEYLRRVAVTPRVSSGTGTASGLQGVRLIENEGNRGFPAAANQGIGIAEGQNILLLNNDTVVTTGWLRHMLDALAHDPKVGLVGPCSNNVSGAQQVPVNYAALSALDGFAWEWGKAQGDRLIEVDRLVGFCLLIRRTVIEKIGLLDERFGIGNFEDDDYCRRAIEADYLAVICGGAFVHHFGHATFRGSGVDFASLLAENERKYDSKWNGDRQVEKIGDVEESPQTGSAAPQVPPVGVAQSRGNSTEECASNAGHEARHDQGSGDFTVRTHPAGGLLLVPCEGLPNSISGISNQQSRLRLSLCMIVRDNETTIGPCLESIRPWVDEIVIVDTGSTDKTPEICRQFGARLFEFPWCDDFSAARNESLRHARGEWIFWMDSDDTIPEECGRKLRALVDRIICEPLRDSSSSRHGKEHEEVTAPAAPVLAYIMQVHCPACSPDDEYGVTVVDHAKLVLNRPDLRFEGRIHEQLLPSIRRAGGEVEWTDIYVVHSGSDRSVAGNQRKHERDLRILQLELEHNPSHPFVLFNLGMTHQSAHRFQDAVGYLERCIAVSRPEESHLRKAFALLSNSLGQIDRHQDAWNVCQSGLALYPDDKELLFRAAALHHHFGRLSEAVKTYEQVLHGHEERHFVSIDQGLASFKARHNLALVYDDMGQFDRAESEWRQIVTEVPDFPEGWRGLGELLVRREKITEVERLIDSLLSKQDRIRREGLILRGRLAGVRGDVAAAVRDLREADRSAPSDLEPLRIQCRALFEWGSPEAAESALQELSARDPRDASVLHNLGAVRQRLKKPAEAAVAFRESLKRRPNCAPTYLHLGNALRDCGSVGEAASAWREALRLDPQSHDARQALEQFGAAV
jgi:GT2 family glycosyltransferase/tetratricopeptide (TPR) repeat protein